MSNFKKPLYLKKPLNKNKQILLIIIAIIFSTFHLVNCQE